MSQNQTQRKPAQLDINKGGRSPRASPIKFNDLKISTPNTRSRSVSPFQPKQNKKKQITSKTINNKNNSNSAATNTTKPDGQVYQKTKKSNYVANENIKEAILNVNKSDMGTFISGSSSRNLQYYESPPTCPQRIILISSRCKNSAVLEKSVKPNVIPILYNYENTTYDSLLALISAALCDRGKVESIACVVTSKPNGLVLLHLTDSNGLFSPNLTIYKSSGLGKFFKVLFETYVESKSENKRLDFLGGGTVQQIETCLKSLSQILGIPVSHCADQMGMEPSIRSMKNNIISDNTNLGELYFAPDKIRNWNSGSFQTLDLFEKIRMVGKGAFGTAVLYRKKDDNSLVILKEMNMTELNSQERSLALNETKVLKLLNHPNIICYYDTFEENGVLLIEMEYADNGTLAQYLADPKNANEDGFLNEQDILFMFQQVVSGIRYMHEQKILHRDLKTANIFLTKVGLVKIGDFGVSKIMDSRNKGANTVLGTPYYISPEICEGKPYNEKSDIWALGCILHEMATRQKTFEGTNLPALVHKIMNGQISPIQGPYSKEFKDLVDGMLARNPDDRPTAHELEIKYLVDLLSRYDSESSDQSASNGSRKTASSSKDIENVKDMRSVLYTYNTSSLLLSLIDGFPSKVQIRQIAIGESHMIAVSYERVVFTWGEGQSGQLGHGTTESCAEPTIVEALKGKSVVIMACGDKFSVFVSDNGIVMTCGDGKNGCLGHGDRNNALRPRLIESLLCVDVTSVACGPRHVVALGSEGEVFSWGEGQHGKLGLGHDRDVVEPTKVTINGATVSAVRCGEDGTMFITDLRTLLACGNNKHNKLGLNERKGFIMMISNRLKKTEVENRKSPTVVKSLKLVIDVTMGKNHTAVLVEPGNIITFGSNKNGQLGTGDNKIHTSPYTVKGLKEFDINAIVCGDTYTAFAVDSERLYFWGTRYKTEESPELLSSDYISNDTELASRPTSLVAAVASVNTTSLVVAHQSHMRNPSASSTLTFSMAQDNGSISDSPSRTSSIQDMNTLDKQSMNNLSKADSVTSATEFELDSNASTATFHESRLPDMIPLPTCILHLNVKTVLNNPASIATTPSAGSSNDLTMIPNSSSEVLKSKDEDTVNYVVYLDTVIAYKETLYIHVRTNAPLQSSINDSSSEKGKRKKSSMRLKKSIKVPSSRSTSSNEAGDEYTSSEASEIESVSSNHAWLNDMDMSDRYVIKKVDSGDETGGSTPIAARGRNVAKHHQPRKNNYLTPNRSAGKRRSPSRKSTQKSTERKSPESHLSAGASIQRAANKYRPQQKKGTGDYNIMSTLSAVKYSRSSLRNGEQGRDYNVQIMRLQKEKKAMEIKYEDLKLETENKLKNMQGMFEKEKQEQENKLKEEINELRLQLTEQQKILGDKFTLLQKSQNGKLSHSEVSIKNSRICSIQ